MHARCVALKACIYRGVDSAQGFSVITGVAYNYHLVCRAWLIASILLPASASEHCQQVIASKYQHVLAPVLANRLGVCCESFGGTGLGTVITRNAHGTGLLHRMVLSNVYVRLQEALLKRSRGFDR